MRRLLASLVIIGPLTASATITRPQAETQSPILVRVADRQAVVVYDTATGQEKTLFRSSGYVPLNSVAVSSDGRHIAFREKIAPDFTAPYRLVVIDSEGNAVRTIPRDVRRFIFCCGGERVAMITGSTHEGGIGFTPEGLFVIGVASGAEKRIAGVPAPYQLHWAPFDSALYVKSLVPTDSVQVYRYDPSGGELTATSHRGLLFSPDGEYYLDPIVEGVTRLYRSQDDLDVTARLPADLVRVGRIPSWIPGSGHALLFTETRQPAPSRSDQVRPKRPLAPAGRVTRPTAESRNYVVDAETGAVLHTFEGRIADGWVTNVYAIPVIVRGRITLARPLQR